jgi:hypothetical protein
MCKHLKEDRHRYKWPITGNNYQEKRQRLDAIVADDDNTWQQFDLFDQIWGRTIDEWAQISWPAMKTKDPDGKSRDWEQMLGEDEFGDDSGFEFDPKLQKEDVPQEVDYFDHIWASAKDKARCPRGKVRELARGSRWYN